MWIMDLKDEFLDAMPLVANMTFHLSDVRDFPILRFLIPDCISVDAIRSIL